MYPNCDSSYGGLASKMLQMPLQPNAFHFATTTGENEAEQLACIMDFLGLPPRGLLLRASRYKLFFDVRTGEPLPVPPNSRGITHRVNSKVLAESLGRTTDPVFLDFLRRCFVYEAGKRMTPEEALQHEWLEGPVLPQRYQSQRAGQVLAQQYR
jgi:dual specificity tyrosine-phosphorylation-regulated kinase 2/3/4